MFCLEFLYVILSLTYLESLFPLKKEMQIKTVKDVNICNNEVFQQIDPGTKREAEFSVSLKSLQEEGLLHSQPYR